MADLPTYPGPVDEAARRRFESAWILPDPPAIEAFLPPLDSPQYLATLEELVAIDLEKLWSPESGAAEQPTIAGLPRIENYLARFPQLRDASVLVRLAKQEYRVRSVFGDRPSLDEYRERFPELDLEPVADSAATTGGAIGLDSTAPRTVRTSAAPPGELGDFEILGEIAHGGMGVVYKARQLSLNRVVALKMIRAAAADDEDVRRFYLEAEAAAQLKHPHIVTVYEFGEHQGRPYFAMEYVDGQSLAACARDHLLSAQLAAQHVRTIAETVEFAHQHSVLHRDLKPSNVLLDESGHIKITDFGLAKRIQADAQMTATGVLVGTPSYMPPEQAAGRHEKVGPAADIYAVGGILYELLTGIPPFRGESVADTLQQVLYAEPVAPRLLTPSTPKDLQTVCLKCLRKDPQARYDSAEALADDLRRYLDGLPILARPVSRVERVWRWCRRRPAIAALAVGLVLVALLGAVGVGTAWSRAEFESSRAEANLVVARRERDNARAAVDEYFTMIAESKLLDVPRMEPLRRDLLETALRYFEDFARQHEQDPTSVKDLAWAYTRLGRINFTLGEYAASREFLDKAVRLVQWRDDLQVERADAWIARSHLAAQTGQYREAITLAESARQQVEELLVAQPGDATLLNGMADCYYVLMEAHEGAGDLEEAISTVRTLIRFREGLCQRWPEDGDYASQLADAKVLLGRQLDQKGDIEGAEQVLLGVLPTLEASRSLSLKTGSNWAWTLGYLAHTEYQKWNVESALRLTDEALVHWEKITLDHPDVPAHRSEMADVWRRKGLYHLALGQPEMARTASKRCTELSQQAIDDLAKDLDKRIVSLKSGLDAAKGLHRLGQASMELGDFASAKKSYRTAATALEQLAEVVPESPAVPRQLAQVLSSEGRLALRMGDAEESIRLVDEALGLLDSLAQNDGDHPVTENARAYAFYYLGRAQLHVRQFEDAESNFLQAIAQWESLTQRLGQNPYWMSPIASCYSELGRARVSQNDIEAAEKWYRAAISLRQQFAAQDPANPRNQSALAISCYNLRSVYRRLGQTQRELATVREAVQLWRKLADSHPQVVEHHSLLATALNGLSLILEREELLTESTEANQQSRDIWSTLVQSYPEDLTFAVGLAGAEINLGRRLNSGQTVSESLEWYSRGIERLEQVLAVNALPSARKYVVNGYSGRASAWETLGNWTQAASDWDRKAKLTSGTSAQNAEVRRMLALVRGGNHERAAIESREFIRDDQPAKLYDAARVLALASEHTAGQQPNGLAEDYATEAAALLSRVADLGFFRDDAAFTWLQDDDEFDTLRERKDFRAMLQGIKSERE